MRKMKEAADNLMLKGMVEWNRIKSSERGDTNFISLLLILAIVVIAGIAFLTLGEEIIDRVGNAVRDFLDKLKI